MQLCTWVPLSERPSLYCFFITTQLDNLEHLGPEQINQQNHQHKGFSVDSETLPNQGKEPGKVFKPCYVWKHREVKSIASSVIHPSNLPSIPSSFNPTVYLVGTLGHAHSTDEEPTLLHMLGGWNRACPCLTHPNHLGHTLRWRPCLDFSLRTSPERSPWPRVVGAISCAGVNELKTPLIDSWAICVWGPYHLVTWLN